MKTADDDELGVNVVYDNSNKMLFVSSKGKYSSECEVFCQ